MNEADGHNHLQQLRKLIQTKEEDLARWRAVFEALAARESGLGTKLNLAGRGDNSAV